MSGQLPNSMTLGHSDNDLGPRWLLRTVVDARIATRLLAAAGAHPQGESIREGGIIVRSGEPDSSAFASCNTARMTVGDIDHFLLCFFEDERRERDLVSDGIARPVFELMGYVPANPAWLRNEENSDHHLTWLYCGGERTTARHPTRRMYTRRGSAPDVCSAYTTRAQLNCLVAQAAMWAPGFFTNGAPPAPAGELAGHPSTDPGAAPTVTPMATLDSGTIATTQPERTPAEPASSRYAPSDEPRTKSCRPRATSQPPRDSGRARRPAT